MRPLFLPKRASTWPLVWLVLAAIGVTLMLTACGGGSEPLTCAPAAQVTVQLYGDSTLARTDQAGPAERLRVALQAAYPSVVLTVRVEAIGHTDARDLPPCVPGADPDDPARAFDSCEAPVRPGAVVVVNSGINDARRALPLDAYAAKLRTFAAPVPAPLLVFQTPGLIDAAKPLTNGRDTAGVAATMRQVAAERGAAVADVQAYMQALPDWRAQLLPDGVHPTDALYASIAADVLYPQVRAAVARLECQL